MVSGGNIVRRAGGSLSETVGTSDGLGAAHQRAHEDAWCCAFDRCARYFPVIFSTSGAQESVRSARIAEYSVRRSVLRALKREFLLQ